MLKNFKRLLALTIGLAIPWTLAYATDYYDASGVPAARSLLNSADIRNEFAAIQTGISEKLPALTGNGGKLVAVNSGGTALEALSTGLTVAQGGTGAATLTGLLQGNGTSAFTAITNSSTVGQVLRVTGASTYGWGAVNLADTDAISGTLPDGNLSSNVPLLDQANTFTDGQKISASVPYLVLNATGAGADLKNFVLYNDNTGYLTLATSADASPASNAANILRVGRTGTTVDSVNLFGTALTWNSNTLFTTANDGSGSGLDADLLDGISSASFLQTSAIGSSVQAWSAHLDDLGALSAATVADQIMVSTAAGTWALESGATARTSLGLTIGTNVQAYSAALEDLANVGIVEGSDLMLLSTGVGTWSAVSEATMKASMNLESGVDVQAWDVFLDDIAALTDPAGDRILFWDDATPNELAWLTVGTGLTITGTTITADSGGTIGVDIQAWDANLDQIAALAVTDSNIIVGNGSAWVAESGATARTSLGLAIGTNVQAYDADLAAIAALAVTDGNFIVGNGSAWVAESGATAQASLGLAIGTNVQAYDAQLGELAGITSPTGVDQFIVSTGLNAWGVENATSARSSLGLGTIATQASSSVSITGGAISGITDLAVADGGTGASTETAARQNLGVEIGVDVQAFDADLTTLGGLAKTDSNFIVGNGTAWVAESGSTARTSLGLGSIATQASNSVSITGGSVTGITDLAVADGGTGASTAAAALANLDAADKEIEQNEQNGSYTLVIGDSGKHIYKSTGSGHTITIPANASVAFDVGTAVTIVNNTASSLSIAITSDTLVLANDGATGTRTLAAYGIATILKVATTTWFISGAGLT